MLVYPKLPVPKGRESEPKLPRKSSSFDKKLAAIAGGAFVLGIVGGFMVRPVLAPDSRIGAAQSKASEADKAAATHKQRADGLDTQVATLTSEKTALEAKLAEAQKAQEQLADKAADAEKIAKEAAEARKKLEGALAKSGTVSADGAEIRLQLVDKVLFKTGDDQLTPRGMKVLDRVAAALKEMPDKQVWVQGHTDDTPIVQPPAPKAPPPKKGQKAAPPPPAPVVKFPTNWELSAARALTVVHYLQDVAKIEPQRLAALAFGQYRPISRRNKAANRRIEIVLYPKPIVKK